MRTIVLAELTKLMNKLLGKCVRYVRIGVWNTQKGIICFLFILLNFLMSVIFSQMAIHQRSGHVTKPIFYQPHIGWNNNIRFMFVETLRLNVQNEFNTYTSREQISLFRGNVMTLTKYDVSRLHINP